MAGAARFHAGPISIEHATRRVRVNGERVNLAVKEYELRQARDRAAPGVHEGGAAARRLALPFARKEASLDPYTTVSLLRDGQLLHLSLDVPSRWAGFG